MENTKQPLNGKAIINKLEEAFLRSNIECDGPHCIGCWKDVVRAAIELVKQYDAKTLPLLEEIAKLKEQNQKMSEALEEITEWPIFGK